MDTPRAKLSDHILLGLIVLAIVMAGVAGTQFPNASVEIKWLGDLFLNMLKMMIVPLVVCSMIAGITSLGDVRKVGKLGGKTILYYMMTTGLAVLVGIVLVELIRPGEGLSVKDLTLPEKIQGKEHFSFIDVILGFFPSNIVGAAANGDILPLIVFSLFFGGILTTFGERARGAVEFFQVCNEALLKMVQIIIWAAPVGIFALVASRLGAEGGDIEKLVTPIAKYFGTVLLGLGIHGFIVLPVILMIAARRNPFRYALGVSKALLTAFSTASSSATLPLTMETCEKENGISPQTAGFVLPLGATINMDGTALYEAVAAIFIAQAAGVDLSAAQQLVIFLTATLAAIGAAGIPEAGLVTMVMVLQAVGLPLEGTALILPIDWLLDRFRTTINVWGDCVGCAVVESNPANASVQPQ